MKTLTFQSPNTEIYHHEITPTIRVVEQHFTMIGEIQYTLQSKHFHVWSDKGTISEFINVSLNKVTCGRCGEPFAHKSNVEELTCPYCKYTSDPCDFPDLTN